jgi:hypothetical protein
MPKGMQPIFTQTVGANSPTRIDINNIPQTYMDLYIVCSLRSTSLADLFFSINGDNSSANLYSTTRLYGQGSTVGTDRQQTNTTRAGDIPGSTATANAFSSHSIYIPNYNSSSFKSLIQDSVLDSNVATGFYNFINASLYRSNAPVNSIWIAAGAGTFLQNSTVTVYGISQ